MTKISLKNLVVVKSLSEETLCFTATAYVDGKKAFEVSNRGHGGCHEYHAYDAALMDRADAYAKSLPPYTWASAPTADHCEVHQVGYDLDMLIDDLIEAMELEKRVKRLLAKVVMIDNGKIYTFKASPRPDVIDRIKVKYPTGVILNTMPLTDAIDAIRAAEGAA